MATKSEQKVQEVAAPEVTALPLSIPLKGLAPQQRVHVIVVGAGGTGGRMLILLPRLLRGGDIVSIVDPDVVEYKNLARQHFHADDVGRAKATVAAERLAAVAPEGVVVIPHVGTLQDTHKAVITTAQHQVYREILTIGGVTYPRESWATIILGGVDNRAARLWISKWIPSLGRVAWIDAGNDFRTGQVCLNLSQWPCQGNVTLTEELQRLHPYLRANYPILLDEKGEAHDVRYGLSLKGNALCFPDTLDPSRDKADAEESCVGFDLQSVGANALAATYACNMLRWLLDGEEIQVMAIMFSTLGGASTFPIMRLFSIETGRAELRGREG